MCQYFKWIDEKGEYNEGVPSVTYYVIEENIITRQLMYIENRYVGSNRKDKKFDHYLAEGEINFEDIESFDGLVIKSSKEEFESHWNLHNKVYLNDWLETKRIFPIGSEFYGEVQVLYPKGVIVATGKSFGIDFYTCEDDDPLFGVYPGFNMRCSVIGFDEVNLWLVIKHM